MAGHLFAQLAVSASPCWEACFLLMPALPSLQVRLGQGKGGGVSSERHARAARMERECVMQEVRIMQAMDSPYVVSFEASFADEKSVFIIMGYAERCTTPHPKPQRFADEKSV